MAGVPIRTDIVEVFVFCRRGRDVSFLQLRRVRPPAAGSWQPVMGHIEEGETAVAAGLRELFEETGQTPLSLPDGPAVWQLEAVDTFFLASANAIMMCPGLAVQVDYEAKLELDDSHDASRWVLSKEVSSAFLWPGQRAACQQILTEILAPDARLAHHLRLNQTL